MSPYFCYVLMNIETLVGCLVLCTFFLINKLESKAPYFLFSFNLMYFFAVVCSTHQFDYSRSKISFVYYLSYLCYFNRMVPCGAKETRTNNDDMR